MSVLFKVMGARYKPGREISRTQRRKLPFFIFHVISNIANRSEIPGPLNLPEGRLVKLRAVRLNVTDCSSGNLRQLSKIL